MALVRNRGFSVAQREELWRRWSEGQSLTTIGLALGKQASSIYVVLAARGGFAPVVPRRGALTLKLSEREEISRGIAAGVSIRKIACRLGRAASTICREIARHGGREHYRASEADANAWRRAKRPKRCRLAVRPQLCRAVARKLKQNWSPRQICEWLKREHPGDESMQVSHETIYRTLFIQARGALKKELTGHLRQARSMRRSLRADSGGQSQIAQALCIRERPAEVEDRAVPGHWEGDLLMGGRSTQIATLVERRSRFVMLVKIDRKDSINVATALAKKVRKLPQELRRSLTWDRGTEMAAHRQFTIATDVKVYFCDPHSPWQRGSNENTNGLLRQYFPKGEDLSAYSQAHLNKVAAQLNDRPRETLGWISPAKALQASVASTG
jgi:IS30 family transposase